MYLTTRTRAEAIQNALDAIVLCCRYLSGDEDDARYMFYIEEFSAAYLTMSDQHLTDPSFRADTAHLLRRGCGLLDSAGGRFQRRLVDALIKELEATANNQS